MKLKGLARVSFPILSLLGSVSLLPFGQEHGLWSTAVFIWEIDAQLTPFGDWSSPHFTAQGRIRRYHTCPGLPWQVWNPGYHLLQLWSGPCLPWFSLLKQMPHSQEFRQLEPLIWLSWKQWNFNFNKLCIMKENVELEPFHWNYS
jgi:hypothetical protein